MLNTLVTRLLGLREYRVLSVEGPVSIPSHLIKQSPVMAGVKLPSLALQINPKALNYSCAKFHGKTGLAVAGGPSVPPGRCAALQLLRRVTAAEAKLTGNTHARALQKLFYTSRFYK